MANTVGRVEELTRQERKALRAQARALRKRAMGIRLCGAITKQARRPCVGTALANGRCRLHGGLARGPKTEEGRRRAIDALKNYRERRKAENAQDA
jgi:hypothetical protein